MAHKSPLSFSANVTAKFIVSGCRRRCRELKVKRFGHIKYVYILYIFCGNNVARPCVDFETIYTSTHAIPIKVNVCLMD